MVSTEKKKFNEWVQLALTPNLNGQEIKILTAILNSHNMKIACDGWCYTSHTHLMKMTHMSQQLLDKWSKRLIQRGLVNKTKADGYHTDYQPNLDAIYELLNNVSEQTEDIEELEITPTPAVLDTPHIKNQTIKMNLESAPTDIPQIDIDALYGNYMGNNNIQSVKINQSEQSTEIHQETIKSSEVTNCPQTTSEAVRMEGNGQSGPSTIQASSQPNKKSLATEIDEIVCCTLDKRIDRQEALKKIERGAKYRSSFISSLRRANEYVVVRQTSCEDWERRMIIDIYCNSIDTYDAECDNISPKAKSAAIIELGRLFKNIRSIGIKVPSSWEPPMFDGKPNNNSGKSCDIVQTALSSLPC